MLKLKKKPVKKKLKLKKPKQKRIRLKVKNPEVLRQIFFNKVTKLFPKSKLVVSEPIDQRRPFRMNTSSSEWLEMKWKKCGGGQAIDHTVTSAAKAIIEEFGFEHVKTLATRHKIYKNSDGARLIVLTDINFHNKNLSVFKLELRVRRLLCRHHQQRR